MRDLIAGLYEDWIPASKQNVMRLSLAFEIEQVSAGNFC